MTDSRTTKTEHLLYESEDGEVIGLDEVQLLEPIKERVPLLAGLMKGSDFYVAYQAALILAAWGHRDGLEHLRQHVLLSKPEEAPLDPDRLASTDDAPDMVAEAAHLYGQETGDLDVRDDIFRECLASYHLNNHKGRLQSCLRRDRPHKIRDDIRAAYERCRTSDQVPKAIQLLPAMLGVDEPSILERIKECRQALMQDSSVTDTLEAVAREKDRSEGTDFLRQLSHLILRG